MTPDTKEWMWVEAYRPHKVSEIILPDRLKKPFVKMVEAQRVPNMTLSGSAGTGKTTMARAVCEEIGLSHLFMNGSEERRIEDLRTKVMRYAGTASLDGRPKVIIIDEADNLYRDYQEALRAVIEEHSRNCSFILTCNVPAKISEAIRSRCPLIDFKLRADEIAPMAGLLMGRFEEILKLEKVEYSRAALATIIKRFLPDYRRLLNELQGLARIDGIKDDALKNLIETTNVVDLIAAFKSSDFSIIRKWVAMNIDKLDIIRFYRLLYDTVIKDILMPESIPEAIILLGKYQFQAQFSVDQEINLAACLCEVAGSCHLK